MSPDRIRVFAISKLGWIKRQQKKLQEQERESPRECLEYIVVHEMGHLLEPTHNDRFVALMNQLMPNWQHCRQVLNRLPVRHETWGY